MRKKSPAATATEEPPDLTDLNALARRVHEDGGKNSELWPTLMEKAHQFASSIAFTRFTGHQQTSEDIASNAVIRVIRGWENYKPQKPFALWLFGMTRQLAVSHLRSKYHHTEQLEDKAQEALVDHRSAPFESVEGVHAGSIREMVTSALEDPVFGGQFAPRTIEIFKRVVLDGEDPAKLAKKFRVSRNTVYGITHRVTKALQDEFALMQNELIQR